MDEDDRKAEMRLTEMVEKHQLELWQAAEQINASSAWSLSSPCVLIKDGKAVVIPVCGVGNHLTVCSYVEHPLIQKWLQIFEADGFEAAFDQCLNEASDEEGEDFAVIYDEWRKDVKARGHGDVGAGDLARFTIKARESFPREVPVMAVIQDRGKTTVMTFFIEVQGLLK